MTSRIIILLTLVLGIVSCGRHDGSGVLESVTVALEVGNNDVAQSEAEALMADSVAFNNLSAGQLCTLARAFVRLNASVDDDSNDALASRCLARARTLDADTVAAFLRSLSGDDAGRMMVLDRVGTYLEVPRDSLVGIEDLDSIIVQN